MRSEVVDLFRQRLSLVITRTGETVSAFARSSGIDRSTLAQLLTGEDARLPRADTLIAVARRAHVSVDWLLGLSQQEETGAEIIGALLQIEEHAHTPVDDQFMRWLKEAEGFRVRTVPVAIPDFLKTEDLLRFEYRKTFEDASPLKLEAVRARLDFMCNPDSEVEVCLSLQSLHAMAEGRDRWVGLSLAKRRQQIDYMLRIYDRAYPGLRLYLYDSREVYSAPFTVFGPKRAVVFLGPTYLVLNGADHIRLFARRFDELIRLAAVQPHAIAETLRELPGRAV